MKKKLVCLLTATFALSTLAAFSFANVSSASASDGPSIVSGGDQFVLLDKYYDETESFVYTADLHFRDGQAGGLVFGGEQDTSYFVINMDRYENHVKLMHFASNGAGGWNVDELRVADFIGNDKMTASEHSMVDPRVRDIENVNLKVVLSIEDEHAYVELFVEGIKRFGIDSDIDLNNLGKSYSYEGGYLGMNCFNGDIYFENVEIGKSDYSYFSEQYRNQYHLQPFAKWTNDPNALCYYNGWYHVFYQTNPFGLLWGEMYWGHARSRDLIHFEFLPLCLFPETDAMGFGPGNAFMWSGCAVTYEYGMSDDIDALNWFPNGEGNGLLAIYTRDGGLQDQVVISSDDEGLTWTKRHRIPQTISGYDYKVDFRDPKVFPLVKEEDHVSVWGMTLSSYNLNRGWFLKSTNLLDWSVAGSFPLPTPECIGIGTLDDGNGHTYSYLTNKSRTYILGTLSYNQLTGNVTFIDEDGVDISTYDVDSIPLKPLDFGPDSYASQSFYINDPASEYYGKDIVLNWFSGDLNASFCTGPGEYAGLRGRWNGGFTTPVEYGLKETTEGFRITQKPITIGNENLDKTNIVDIACESFDYDSQNPLASVHTHIFELDAAIETHDNASLFFRVDVGSNEYMQFGWNETDGYYVDRTYLDDKGINTNVDWHVRYSSHILGDSDVKTFYVLSDNGGLEVFCEDYSISFYFVTTASIYSTSAQFKAEDAVVNKLKINEISSAYRTNVAPGEGVLYVSSDDVELGTTFMKSKFITCWFSGHLGLTWEELENDGVVSYQTSDEGINLTALDEGTASFKVSVGEQFRIINVTVYEAYFDSDFTFKDENIVSGNWLMTSNEIVGEMASGNAFILTEESGTDFTIAGSFSITSGTAASLVFRAANDMSSYLVANYDTNEKVVKLWSRNGELTRSDVIEIDPSNILLSIKAIDRNISINVNGHDAIEYFLPLNEPLAGRFGLNVFSGRAVFSSFEIVKEDYVYEEGDLAISINNNAYVSSVTNISKGNVRLAPDFYYQDEDNLYIRESYFRLLDIGIYKFRIITSTYSFEISVEVSSSFTPHVDDVVMEYYFDVVVYVGNISIVNIKVNGLGISEDEYTYKNYTLTIKKECFRLGENEVTINDSVSFLVTRVDHNGEVVTADPNQPGLQTTNGEINANLPLIVTLSVAFVTIIGAGLSIYLIRRRNAK